MSASLTAGAGLLSVGRVVDALEALDPSDRQPLIRAVDVGLVYETAAETVRAVRGVSLTVCAGEFVLVQGPSGSGKSSLLRLLAGLESPSAGGIEVMGRSLEGLDARGRSHLRLTAVAVIFQQDNLIEEFTAGENVAFPLELRHVPGPGVSQEVAHWLDRVGLHGLEHRLPVELSGGQQQRVGIARALAGDRRILLADEPTGALDSTNARGIFALIRQLCDETGAAAVVASHDGIAADYADRTVVMRDGAICSVAHSGRAR